MKSMDWTGWDRLIHLTDKHPTKWLRLFRLCHQSYSKFKLVLFTSLFYKGRVDTPRIDPVMFSTSEYYLESTLSLSTEVPHLERECRGIPSGLTCFRILRSFAQKEARKLRTRDDTPLLLLSDQVCTISNSTKNNWHNTASSFSHSLASFVLWISRGRIFITNGRW